MMRGDLKNNDRWMRLSKRYATNEMIWSVCFDGGVWLWLICCEYLA
jgi:hypothetical protein